VIHTVGPCLARNHNEKELLASCYRNCLKLASDNNLRTIAFPSISTGAYGFPSEPAAEIALTEIRRFLKNNSTIEKVVIVCFSEDSFKICKNKSDQLSSLY
jgi:O-acetyl-ADP-ribose deacetylase (regulator of RNase III)